MSQRRSQRLQRIARLVLRPERRRHVVLRQHPNVPPRTGAGPRRRRSCCHMTRVPCAPGTDRQRSRTAPRGPATSRSAAALQPQASPA
ncbi:hypothetical protein KL922_004760 [Ogataea haglerorum]|nr:hypothetical protein KL922_004760 [Ogataea haglerorum]